MEHGQPRQLQLSVQEGIHQDHAVGSLPDAMVDTPHPPIHSPIWMDIGPASYGKDTALVRTSGVHSCARPRACSWQYGCTQESQGLPG